MLASTLSLALVSAALGIRSALALGNYQVFDVTSYNGGEGGVFYLAENVNILDQVILFPFFSFFLFWAIFVCGPN